MPMAVCRWPLFVLAWLVAVQFTTTITVVVQPLAHGLTVRRAAPSRRAAPRMDGGTIDYVAGFFASAISTSAVYPVETYKVRLQTGSAFEFGGDESPFALLRGIELGLAKECPNAAVYIGVYEWLRTQALALPAATAAGGADDARVLFLVALVCGALGDAAGSPLRMPFELAGKNIQAGRVAAGQSFGAALEGALPATGRAEFVLQSWLAVLSRDMPFGALQLIFYELACLLVAPPLGDTFVAHLLEGGLAGGMTAIVTTPVDCSITRLMVAGTDDANIGAAAAAIWREQGPIGFTRGWNLRAAQFAPAAMLFFASFETFRYYLGKADLSWLT